MHGGVIGFASEVSVGSTFTFYVKSRDAAISQRQEVSSAATVNFSTSAEALALPNRSRNDKDHRPDRLVITEVDSSDLHVLIVEDNIVNQHVLAKQLRNIGINVTVANHGGEALDHLRTATYCVADRVYTNKLSLILMDWEMPVCDFGAHSTCEILTIT